MRIISYREEFKQQVIDLILHIQNEEAKINLALQQQPDLPICWISKIPI